MRSLLCVGLAALAVSCATTEKAAEHAPPPPEASGAIALRVRTSDGVPVACPAGWTQTIDVDGTQVLRPPKGQEVAAFEEREKLSHAQRVTSASIVDLLRDTVCQGSFAPEAKADHQWQLKHVNAYEAWKLAPVPGGKQLGEGAVVCHIDTGYTDHPVLRDALDARRVTFFGGFSEGKPQLDARDPLTGPYGGHGTGTGAMIAGLEGVAPRAKLLPIRATDTVILSHDTEIDVARAIRYAIRSGCRVISMSLGTPWTLPGEDEMRNAVFEAAASGVIVVAAAGNCWGNVVEPASYSGAIAVGATDVFDQPWSHTSDGPLVVIAAPGDTIWTPKTRWDADGGYDHDYMAGTSYSAAMVAGAAALWLAFNGPDIQRAYPDPSDVPRAFRWLLHNRAFRPVKWQQLPNRPPWQLGQGVLDAKMLLGAKLPDAAALQSEPSLDKEDRLAYAKRRFHELEARGEATLNLSANARAMLESDPVALEELLYLVQQRKDGASAAGQPAPTVTLDADEVRRSLCDHCARLKRYLEQ